MSTSLQTAEPIVSVARMMDRARQLRDELRALESAMAQYRTVDALARAEVDDCAPDTLAVSASGRCFRLPGGRWVDLSTRGSLRRILQALVDQRIHAPGVALSRAGVLEAGWPGQRVLERAAAGRVYTAIATLRRKGLRTVLLRRDDGYLLDPNVSFVRVGEPPR